MDQGTSENDVTTLSYHCIESPEARQSPDLLRACSELFSGHYGVWGERGSRVGARPGARVTMRPGRLKDTCLFDEEACSVVVAREAEGRLIGHAFVCTFPFTNDSSCEGDQAVLRLPGFFSVPSAFSGQNRASPFPGVWLSNR